ncbi:MAG TPA: hypothetical protein VKA12_04635 [Roseiarcus sp.]|nr:hypothetical protein [Roseiarcus sp.]
MCAARRSPASLTSMQIAFLDALIAWAQRQTNSTVALASGRVDPLELRQVVIAILRARGDRDRHVGGGRDRHTLQQEFAGRVRGPTRDDDPSVAVTPSRKLQHDT